MDVIYGSLHKKISMRHCFITPIFVSSFYQKYLKRKKKLLSVLCVGLDPDPRLIPSGFGSQSQVFPRCKSFLRCVIQATSSFTVAYKLNCAFYEALGPKGFQLFADILSIIREEDPECLVIADAKRGDVSHSSAAYARAFFQEMGCDAITLNPYMGMQALEPFWSYGKSKACILLCNTSNPDSSQFQGYGEPPLYLEVARQASKLNRKSGNIWLVVGATRSPKEIALIRENAPELPFLMPGAGAQGGDWESCLEAAGEKVLIHAGRSILYGSTHAKNTSDFAQKQCRSLVDSMRRLLQFS